MIEPPPFDRRVLPPGLKVGEWRCADGWRLRRFDWPADDAATPRGRLLFLSGRADFAEKYLEAMAHWHARGWALTSFDWRGQGGSRGDGARAQAGFDPLLDDLAGFVAAWTGESAGPHVVVAHSMGGHLALRLIVERGWRPDAGVFAAPMLGINAGPIPRSAARLIATAMTAIGLGGRGVWRRGRGDSALRQTTLTGSRARFEDELWWVRGQRGWASLPPSWAWLAAAYASMAALERAPVPAGLPPLLVLIGGRDRLVSNPAARRGAARLGAGLRIFPGAAHELLREADDARLGALAAIDAFIERAAAR